MPSLAEESDTVLGGESVAAAATQKVDEKVDGVAIIDATGTLLLVNKVAYKMFGYTRGELEGKNVSALMPQPFSSRHNSYLNNYLTTGVAKILNTQRHVVALRKVRATIGHRRSGCWSHLARHSSADSAPCLHCWRWRWRLPHDALSQSSIIMTCFTVDCSSRIQTAQAKLLCTTTSAAWYALQDHTMFPITLFVKRLSGTGQESVFMGVLKPVVDGDTNVVRVWCTSTGTILCSDDK